MTTWDLICEGKFVDACNLADKEFSEGGQVLSIRNKIIALLLRNEPSDAMRECEKALSLSRGDNDFDYIFLGVTFWWMGRSREAIEMWKSSLRSKYTDAAGGVEALLLVYFGGVRISDKTSIDWSRGKLKSKTMTKNPNWPMSVCHYLVGKKEWTDINGDFSQLTAIRMKQECQAWFYHAVKSLATCADSNLYREGLLKCSQYGSAAWLKPEFHLAKAELQK